MLLNYDTTTREPITAIPAMFFAPIEPEDGTEAIAELMASLPGEPSSGDTVFFENWDPSAGDADKLFVGTRDESAAYAVGMRC
jgi:hypothetical protein